MERLYDAFRLSGDGWSFLLRMLITRGWGMDVVSPGDVYLSRRGDRIDSDDPRLDSNQGWGILEGIRDGLDFWDAASLFASGFAFQDDDQSDPEWFPQGLTGTADADPSGEVDGEKFLLVAWYRDVAWEPEDPHSIVSLVNVSSMDDVTYRHLLLVNPVMNDDGVPSFESVDSHCGGIVWFGRWLYVATNSQLLLFDMEAISDLKPQNEDYLSSDKMGYHDGIYHARGYRYIVPLFAVYTIEDNGLGKYFDTLGLDRSTDAPRLVAAAYVNDDSELDEAVVVFFDLDESTGLLETTAGYIEASDAAWTGEKYVQGVQARGDTVWLCLSSEVNKLLVREVGASGGSEYHWAYGGEGLTYSQKSDNLWNVTEFEGKRICFCVKRDSVP